MKGDREQGRGIPWKAEYMGVPKPALDLPDDVQESVRQVLQLVLQGTITHAEASKAIDAIQKAHAPATPEPPRSPGFGFYRDAGLLSVTPGGDFNKFFARYTVEYEDGPVVANMPTAAEAIAEAEAAFAEEPV